MKKIKQLYGVFDQNNPFNIQNMCKDCSILCARKRNVHWLLNEEVGNLKEILKISKTENAYFFDGGLCSNLENGECKIYEMRPFECRLNPLSILEIEGKLHWIVYKECPLITKFGENFVKKLAELADKIEPYLDQNIMDNFRKISAAIKKFDPLVGGKDFIVLRKFGEKE